MQTRRQTLKQSAVVAGLLAGTGLFPQYAHAFNKAAFDAKTLGDALKALGASGAPQPVTASCRRACCRAARAPAATRW